MQIVTRQEVDRAAREGRWAFEALVALRMHVQTTLTLAVRARDALDAVGEVNDWNRSVEQLQAFMDSLPKER